jgi:hypothetical protein
MNAKRLLVVVLCVEPELNIAVDASGPAAKKKRTKAASAQEQSGKKCKL